MRQKINFTCPIQNSIHCEQCISIADCGPLTNPVHGTVSAPVTTYQNVAAYTCDSLYQLNGTATLTCEADGNWAPDPPTCDDIGMIHSCRSVIYLVNVNRIWLLEAISHTCVNIALKSICHKLFEATFH